MKSLLKYLLALVTVGLLPMIAAHAQSAPTSMGEGLFTGHMKKNENVLKEAKDIIVGKFTALGYPGSDASGEDFYEQGQVEVISALRGSLAGTLRVGYSVRTVPGKDQEIPPVVGTEYIMFIQKLGPNECEIKKLLPATDENITKIKALIAAAPAGK